MKTVIEMAQEAGWGQAKAHDDCLSCGVFDLERFAALVRADEREVCAKVCEAFGEIGLGVNSAAAAIRARGNT